MMVNLFKILTELTVIIHFLFVLFVICGGFLAYGKSWLIIVHLGAVIWAVYAELAPGVVCPLTVLENYFAFRAGIQTYHEDFIARYLVPIIYQEDLKPIVQYSIVGIVAVINVFAYRKSWKRKAVHTDGKNKLPNK